MKNILLKSRATALVVLMLAPIGAYGQANEVVRARVDRRVELMSIVARPSVQSTSPFANGAQDVDPSITEITFTFDRPLEPKGVSINFGPGGPAQFPIVKVIGYAEDGKTLTLQLKMNPATTYEFILTEQSFKTREGYPLKPYTMKFRTRQ